MTLPTDAGLRLLGLVRANIARAHVDIEIPATLLPSGPARAAVEGAERHLVAALDEIDRAQRALREQLAEPSPEPSSDSSP